MNRAGWRRGGRRCGCRPMARGRARLGDVADPRVDPRPAGRARSRRARDQRLVAQPSRTSPHNAVAGVDQRGDDVAADEAGRRRSRGRWPSWASAPERTKGQENRLLQDELILTWDHEVGTVVRPTHVVDVMPRQFVPRRASSAHERHPMQPLCISRTDETSGGPLGSGRAHGSRDRHRVARYHPGMTDLDQRTVRALARAMPKAELHLHLDGSLRIETALEHRPHPRHRRT